VTARGNVLDVRYENLPGEDSCSGEIVMNRQRRGAGHYSRLKAGEDLWGFWDLQVRDARTLLVH